MSRIRANTITNQNANGAPNFPDGITVTGVVTATTTNQNITGDLTVSGNLGVGGTVTYEDVKNIDSVGIVTAREGVFIPDSKQLKIGNTASSPDLKIFHDGTNNYINSANGNLYLQNSNQSKAIVKGGSLSPNAENIDLGESGLRWQNVHAIQFHGGGANLTGVGISDFDTWYLTSSFNGSVDPISNNLSRYTSGGANKLGTGMSVSSGVFTFPATGFWRITCKWRGQRQSGHQSQYQKIEIKSTSDNFSSSNILAVADGAYYDNYPTGGRQNAGTASIIFDVTNTSTHKIRFAAVLADNSGNGNEILGASSIALTSFEFIKLADT